MKATSLLESQHRNIEALFEKLECRQGSVAATLETLANHLVAHMAIEQEIFYPAIKALDVERVNESYEEHALGELALKRLLGTNSQEPTFKARFTALKELTLQHLLEEEEELFPQVEEALSEDALLQLGKTMKARFEQVFESGFEAAMPKSVAHTSADVARLALAQRGELKESLEKVKGKAKAIAV
jgi:iron-sulfur cluster repair protein YtfE (RIC family)